MCKCTLSISAFQQNVDRFFPSSLQSWRQRQCTSSRCWLLATNPHGDLAQNNVISIFTAVRILGLTQKMYFAQILTKWVMRYTELAPADPLPSECQFHYDKRKATPTGWYSSALTHSNTSFNQH
jgi:hypothetical protein